MLTIPTERDLAQLREILAPNAKAQNYQDVFAFSVLGRPVNGYFVEVGAANGMQFSNTYLLEKFGWQGILVEPAVAWHPHIQACRQARLDTRCAWSSDGDMVPFCQFPDSNLSTVERFAANQISTWRTSPSARYVVESATLQTILRETPHTIDYLSLDVEGSEWEVLSAYDFSHQFRVITCEHNFKEPQRSQIHNLLTSRGYLRVCEHVSKYDDWYVNPTLTEARS